MTLQEFAKEHPAIIQYESGGVAGIDLKALSEHIKKSRYLRSKQSFVFLVKNYKKIINGDFDDFKDPKEVAEEKRVQELRKIIANVLAFEKRVDDKFRKEMEEETRYSFEEIIWELRHACSNKEREERALSIYKRLTTFAWEYYGKVSKK